MYDSVDYKLPMIRGYDSYTNAIQFVRKRIGMGNLGSTKHSRGNSYSKEGLPIQLVFDVHWQSYILM